MTKYLKATLIFIVSSWLLVSCSTPAPLATVLPLSTSTGTGERIAASPPSEPTAIANSVPVTPNVAPTLASLFDNPAQVTDGRLRMSIKLSDGKCYQTDNFVPLTITYENLTGASLNILDYNVMDTHAIKKSKGQLFPEITTALHKKVYAPYDLMTVEVINPNATLVHSLPAKTAFAVSVKYYLSQEMVAPDSNAQLKAQPVPPGQYLLRFIYDSFGQQDSWEGAISSNQINICIAG